MIMAEVRERAFNFGIYAMGSPMKRINLYVPFIWCLIVAVSP